jgi:formylglycine-generating enzyme required for sulfatase activity
MNATFFRFLGAVAVVSFVLSTSAKATAPAGRYTTTGGTVFDTKTKLTWQQTAPAATYTWAAATTYCQSLSLAGTGWRLPTSKELQTIVDYSQSNPSIDPTAFPATPATYFWSSSPLAGSPSSAWFVYFSSGITGFFDVTSSTDVRCVR